MSLSAVRYPVHRCPIQQFGPIRPVSFTVWAGHINSVVHSCAASGETAQEFGPNIAGVTSIRVMTMRTPLAVGIGLLAIGLFGVGPGETRAQSWNNPDRPQYRDDRRDAAAEEARLRELTDALDKLLEKGVRERLADPWFLKDLRDLVGKYHRPWSVVLLRDDFSGRGTAPQAPWRTVSGEFRVDWRYGLRSLALPQQRRAESTRTEGTQQSRQGDAVQQLFGALLNQALKGAQQDTESASGPTQRRSDGELAEIVAPIKISNAFSITAEVTLRPLRGAARNRIALGVYQGQSRAGYRLIVSSDGARTESRLRLLRVNGRGGASIVDQVDLKYRFDAETPTALVWTRTQAGEMQIAIEGEQVLQVTDRGFRDPFDGFLLRNRSGDMALRRIRIDGT